MIIIRIWEGLGNQMFQYAYARALQEKGVNVRLDLSKSYDNICIKYRNNALREIGIQNYRISIPCMNGIDYGKYAYLHQDTFIRKIVFWLGTHHLWNYKFYEEIVQENSDKVIKGNYYVKGWFQNEKYFKSIRSILVKEFVPKEKILVSKKLREAFEDKESVSIHVRRGDYVKLNLALNEVYYKRAINYIQKKYRNPIFLIFSDDLRWVRNNIPINGRYIYVNEDRKLKDFEELFIMSRCKSNIISNSTFSWWAAWLNENEGKMVVAPKKWVKIQENIVPDEWIVL